MGISREDEGRIIQDMGMYSHDPLGFVYAAYDWGVGELKGEVGPRDWQARLLDSIGMQLRDGKQLIREAVVSGHGVGKSSFAGMLTQWAMSTFSGCRGIITANTEGQLKTKTWPEIEKWHRLSVCNRLDIPWFNIEATSIASTHKESRMNWRMDRVTWNESRPAAFAGLHNKGKRIIVFFDEASEVHDNIWDVTLGALTDEDTEIIWIVLGNPTASVGRFRECFGKFKHRWGNTHLDARDVEGTNKEYLQSVIDDFGDDSDIARIRVKGMFPRGSATQFIDSETVYNAQHKEAVYIIGDPLIGALDIARGGDDDCVIRFRRGMDARTIPSIVIPGTEARDSMKLVSIVVNELDKRKPDAFFVDATGVGGPIGDRLRQLGYNAVDVQFGAGSPEHQQANMVGYMWQRMKEWFVSGGAIDERVEWDNDFSREYSHDGKDRLVLESKKQMKSRGLASPDHADALALTFAAPVAPTRGAGSKGRGEVLWQYDPFSPDRMG